MRSGGRFFAAAASDVSTKSSGGWLRTSARQLAFVEMRGVVVEAASGRLRGCVRCRYRERASAPRRDLAPPASRRVRSRAASSPHVAGASIALGAATGVAAVTAAEAGALDQRNLAASLPPAGRRAVRLIIADTGELDRSGVMPAHEAVQHGVVRAARGVAVAARAAAPGRRVPAASSPYFADESPRAGGAAMAEGGSRYLAASSPAVAFSAREQ